MSIVKLKINGHQHCVGDDVSSNTTLLEYVRKVVELRGTKYMCLAGRCGACLVSVRKGPGEPVQAVNACLVLITSCHNWEITTIEKIGNCHEGYHDIQKSIVAKNGTQCGYCTPGWVVALYSLLKGKGKMTMHEIEQSVGSNICRCTGYRPILDALKMFGKDAPVQSIIDIEDMNICDKSGNVCSNGNCDDPDWCLVTNKETSPQPVIHIKLKDGKEWYRVEEIHDVFKILNLIGDNSYMLVHGNTGRGIVPIDEFPQTMIDISGVFALKGSIIDQNLKIGSGTTITEMMNLFETISNKENFRYLKEFNDLLKYFANIPVKNIGTIAGNLMLTHKNNGVVSDLILMFEAVGAVVTVLNDRGIHKTLSMTEFLKEDMTGKLIVDVRLPPLSNEYKIVCNKIAGKAENAGSILSAAFLYKLNINCKVLECRIVLGLTYLTRATNTERYLVNKTLFKNDTLHGAVKTLNNELIVVDKPPAMSAKYRKNLAISLFYKSLLTICPPNILGSRYRSGAIDLRKTRPLSQARQIFDTDANLYPLNQPMSKVEAMIQCAGEAPYTDDVPSMPNEVYAAFVLSTIAVGKIDNIDASVALKLEGVLAFYSAKDIPGVNSYTAGIPPASTTNQVVFCDGDVKYFNQPIGIVVAESQYLAEKAAKLVTVKYSNVTVPVLDILAAKDDPNRTSLYKEFPAKETGNDIAKVIKGDVTIRGQYHTCMETLVCVSHPTEEGLQVYSATQYIDSVQLTTSRALNIPQNKIDVYTRRVGGSFGFKISQATQIAVACSLAAYKLHRPCRFIQNLKTNMRAMGKRFPVHADFEISVNNDGVIQRNNYNLFEDNGYLVNEPLAEFTADCYNNCYKNTRWHYKLFNTTTDTASNTWCRSPGNVECIGISELMMEQISYEMSLDPIKLRLANLDTDEYDAIREMVETLIIDCQYTERKAAMEKFNKENRWKKRGLRFAFMIWNPITLPIYLDVTISVYSGDGTVIITHSGIEMGQGINTKAVQICAYVLNIPTDMIQVKAPDSKNCPNGFVTGASVASLNMGIGVKRCSEALMRKLEPIKAKMDNPTWLELIAKAFAEGVPLQTHEFVNMKDNAEHHVHGVACAEVELDVLTGENQIVRVDLAEDVGQSVSPGVDIGQIEGAFLMGLGYWTTERLVCNKSTGELLTDSLNQYWVPQALDIPQDLRIYFRKKSSATADVMGSKATGEPAASLSIVCPLATREATVAARCESGIPPTDWFDIDGPYTVEQIYLACATRLEDFKFY